MALITRMKKEGSIAAFLFIIRDLRALVGFLANKCRHVEIV